MKVLKFFIKWFFYPRMMIADPRFNLLCFMFFLGTLYFIPEPELIYYICGWIVYLIIGQNLPSKWVKEFYNLEYLEG